MNKDTLEGVKLVALEAAIMLESGDQIVSDQARRISILANAILE